MYCYWCNNEIKGWYIKYNGHVFCRNKNDSCIKDYLYDKADDDMSFDYWMSQEELKAEAAELEEEIRKDLGLAVK